MTWICQLSRRWDRSKGGSKMFGASLRPGKDIWRRFLCKIYMVCPYKLVTCKQNASKKVQNLQKKGRFCRPAISSSKWGASLLKVTYGFLWLWSSYFSLTAAQYNTHELFNSSLPNQMGIFSPQQTFRLSLYRTIQVIPASKSNPIPGSNFRVWKWSEPSKNLPWKQLTIDPSCLDRTS